METAASAAQQAQGLGVNPLLVNNCPLGLASAMNKIAEYLGAAPAGWCGTTLDQQEFRNQMYLPYGNEVTMVPEIETAVSQQVAEINRFLADRGFAIQLRELFDPQGFAVASVLDVMAEFAFAGSASELISAATHVMHPAVLMKQPGFVVAYHPKFDKPIFILRTTTDDNIVLVEADYPTTLALLGDADQAVATSTENTPSSLLFPMVDYRSEADISALEGMEILRPSDSQRFLIVEALQENRLRINQFGCRAQSATAMAVARGFSAPTKPYVIDGPFSVVISRKGVHLPLFGAYIEEAHWGNPGDLAAQ